MQLVNRFFNLRPGDFIRGFPLFLYYFLIITFYVLGRSARDSLFQASYDKTMIPYADIAVAVVSTTLVAIYLRASRGANLKNLQMGTLLVLAAMLPVQWWGVHVAHKAAVSAIFYVWVGVCGILSVSQVWMLANAVWTTREAKRLFGPLGSAGILGGIVAGFLTKWIALRLGTDAILLVMAGFVVLCPPLVLILSRQIVADGAADPVEVQTGERASQRATRVAFAASTGDRGPDPSRVDRHERRRLAGTKSSSRRLSSTRTT